MGFIPEFKDALLSVRPTLNLASRKNYLLLKEALFKDGARPRILCVGAGKVPGEGIDALGPDVIKADIEYSENLDIACDGGMLSFKESSFDAVILQAVLEHAKNHKDIIKESRRVLKDGGYIYAEMPFIQGEHMENDYRRFTLEGLRSELGEFTEIKAGICCGPFSGFVCIASALLSLIFSLNNRWLFDRLNLLFLYLLLPLKYLDVFFGRSKNAEMIASAFYFIGRK